MFGRQTSGSVVCASCGYLVGVNDPQCYHCGRRNPGLWGFAPVFRRLGNDMGFVPFVIGTCIVVYALMLALSGMNTSGSLLSFGAPSQLALILFGASGAMPVFGYGRWWTLLSASWLHAGLLHIFFNMMWIRQLGPTVAELYGPGRMVIVYTISGVTGFAASSLAGRFLPFFGGAGITVGASASIFGLLGALVYYGRRSGSSAVRGQAINWAITLFVLGLIMPGVDNFAHAGGFAGGFLMSRVLDPLKPERIDHVIGAVVCLAASLLSIIVPLAFAFLVR